MGYTHIFDGLSKKLPAFLEKLRRNNTREWFHSHREEFQHSVVTPLAALAETLAPDMARLDSLLIKKLSRPQRDTRFSKDKSPYRTEMWFAFRRIQPDWTEYPAFFFEATPEHCRWGMGYYSARPATMSALRDIVQEDHKRFLAAIAGAAGRGFELNGELYKRHLPIPPGTPKEIAELIRHRSVYLGRMMAYGPSLLSRKFAETLAADYTALGAMYRIFCLANDRQEMVSRSRS
jgi:uncharacterized protein (TIGR02453 family)